MSSDSFDSMPRYRGNNQTIESTNTTPLLNSEFQLYNWDDLPDWQKDNHFIKSFYIKETNSFQKCLESLFYLHNESVNIYTHLIPGLGYLVILGFFLQHFIPIYPTTTKIDELVFSIFIIGASSALTLSSCFHCFKSHSEKIAIWGNKLDYLGIVILIITSMVSILYYSLMDYPEYRLFFWILTTVLGTICGIFSLKDRFRSQEWRPYRAMMFVMFGLSGVLPILMGFSLMGIKETFKKAQLSWILTEGLLYILGAIIYAARVPERFAPGSFDVWGHGHQVFHVLVVIAAGCHGRALIGAYKVFHGME